ncbi:Uncharacterised protein [Atlantibacter hermannii]|nr:Uncharacterised protein [Atlantibacter hermannii]
MHEIPWRLRRLPARQHLSWLRQQPVSSGSTSSPRKLSRAQPLPVVWLGRSFLSDIYTARLQILHSKCDQDFIFRSLPHNAEDLTLYRIDIQRPFHFARFRQRIHQRQALANDVLQFQAGRMLQQKLPAKASAAFGLQSRYRPRSHSLSSASGLDWSRLRSCCKNSGATWLLWSSARISTWLL